jgi:ribulose-phosphate 3-epimerase
MTDRPVKIAPSILSCDFGRLAEEIAVVEEAGADWIHVDVMDGHFVPNLTIGPVVVRGARRATELPLDVHLMIEEPDRYLEAFVHQEACRHLHRSVERIRELGARAGVALNPATPLGTVEEVLPLVDLLLVMSVDPGFGGQSYIHSSTRKIERARRALDELRSEAELEVDGGIGADNADAAVRAGATVLVAGSAVFGHPDGPGAGFDAVRAASGA